VFALARLRVLRTAKASLTRTFYLDEQPTGATGAVHVTITRLDGTPVENNDAAGPDANQLYTYTFGGRDVLDELIVSWAATVAGDLITLDQDRLEIVGGFYFGLAEGRNVDPQALSNTTKFTTADLIDKRIAVEDECERITEQAHVPRFCREILDGQGQSGLQLLWPWTRAVRSVSVRVSTSSAYIPMTTDQLARVAPSDDGVLRLDQGLFWPTTGFYWGAIWPYGRRNIIVEYEHGLDCPSPDIVRGSKIRFKSMLLQSRSALTDRGERVAVSEAGIVHLASPSEYSTGIDEVDAAYARAPSPRPSFG
jgi:hypothetical protein